MPVFSSRPSTTREAMSTEARVRRPPPKLVKALRTPSTITTSRIFFLPPLPLEVLDDGGGAVAAAAAGAEQAVPAAGADEIAHSEHGDAGPRGPVGVADGDGA